MPEIWTLDPKLAGNQDEGNLWNCWQNVSKNEQFTTSTVFVSIDIIDS